MKYDKNELLTALHYIKNICYQSSNCEDCPLSDDDNNFECEIALAAPCDWEIKDVVTPWKAFY